MAKHPKPHFVKHNGKWQACYGNQSKGSKFRMQMVIAEGVSPFDAHCRYLEALDPQAQALARAVRAGRGGKPNLSFLMTVWRRLRRQHGHR